MVYSAEIDYKSLIIGSSNNKLNDYASLKNAIEKTINTIENEQLIELLRFFPKIKPTIKFETLFYILNELRGNAELSYEFEVMRNYIGCDFDIFTFVNYLRKH